LLNPINSVIKSAVVLSTQQSLMSHVVNVVSLCDLAVSCVV